MSPKVRPSGQNLEATSKKLTIRNFIVGLQGSLMILHSLCIGGQKGGRNLLFLPLFPALGRSICLSPNVKGAPSFMSAMC